MLNSALHLFVKKGFGGTTVDEIADATNLTKGAVYFYFADKADVLAALIKRAEDRIYAPIIAAISETEHPVDLLVRYLHWISQKGISDADLLLLPILISLEFKGHRNPAAASVARMYRALHRALANVIARGQKLKIFHDRVPPRELAAVVVSLSDGALLELLRRGKGLDGKRFLRGLRTTMLAGFSIGSSEIITEIRLSMHRRRGASSGGVMRGQSRSSPRAMSM